MPTYRVAFIGCGRRAKSHLVGVRADPRCQIVALADVNRAAAEAMNAEAGLQAAIYTDYELMLAREKPDAVVACLWTPLHLAVFRAAVAAGVKAVLSEKPMAPAWGSCLEMAQLAEQSHCQLTFSHQRRFAAGNLLARRLIRAGRFGKVQRLDLYAPQNLLDCGTHTFDQALSFNDESPGQWVLGAVDGSKIITWFGVSAENLATGLVVFANGVRAQFQFGAPGQDMPAGVRIHGSEGFLEVSWDGRFGRGAIYRDPSWSPPDLPDDTATHMVGLVRNAFDCLESGAEPELSHRKALRATEIIFALYESVRRRAAVTLPLDTRDHAFLALLAAGQVGPPAPQS